MEYPTTKEEESIDFQIKLKQGKAYEKAIAKFFKINYEFELGIYESVNDQYNKGECKEGIEIKYDMKSVEKGNLYIEVAEKRYSSNQNFVSSGIYRNDNSRYYLIGNEREFFIFKKEFLQNIYTNGSCEGLSHVKRLATGTSQGMLLPISNVKTYLYINKTNINVFHLEIDFNKYNGLVFYNEEQEYKELPEPKQLFNFLNNMLPSEELEKFKLKPWNRELSKSI